MENLESGESQESSVASTTPDANATSEVSQSSVSSGNENSGAPEKVYRTQAEVDEDLSRRLEREKRKMRRELEREYGMQHPQGYANHAQPSNPQSYQPAQAEIPQIDPEVYKTVASIAQQSYQQQRIHEEQYAKLNEFMQMRVEEESKDPDFADFSMDMEKRCPQGMLEAAVYLKDPTILYRIFKENPSEFNKISRMSPQEQYLKVAEYRGEYRGRSLVPPPKVVSSAPPPMEAPKSTGSSYQKPLNEISSHERLQQRRRERKKAMTAH